MRAARGRTSALAAAFGVGHRVGQALEARVEDLARALHQPVGVQQQHAPAGEGGGGLEVAGEGHDPQRHRAGALEEDRLLAAQHQGRRVPGVDPPDLPHGRVHLHVDQRGHLAVVRPRTRPAGSGAVTTSAGSWPSSA